MARTILFRDKPTPRTGPRGVPWIDETAWDSSALGLVHDKVRQLPEAPIMVLTALPFANRCPVTDPGQLFQDQRGLRVFGIRHKFFGNGMVL